MTWFNLSEGIWTARFLLQETPPGTSGKHGSAITRREARSEGEDANALDEGWGLLEYNGSRKLKRVRCFKGNHAWVPHAIEQGMKKFSPDLIKERTFMYSCFYRFEKLIKKGNLFVKLFPKSRFKKIKEYSYEEIYENS